MRRTLLIPLTAAMLLLATLAPALALGSTAAPDRIDSASTTALTAAPSLADVARIRMSCSVIRRDGPAVRCRWEGVAADSLRGYKVWRTVGAPGSHPRRLIGRIPAGAPLRFVDTHVRRGRLYTYWVVAVATDGTRLAVGGPVAVRIPGRHHALRLVCAVGTVGDAHGVGCKWSASKHPGTNGYILWRSVDGAAREAIYRTGLDGPRHFFDTDVKAGQVIRYAVVAVDEAGHRIGRGGPVRVRIPAWP